MRSNGFGARSNTFRPASNVFRLRSNAFRVDSNVLRALFHAKSHFDKTFNKKLRIRIDLIAVLVKSTKI
jgi:hypothetical protein